MNRSPSLILLSLVLALTTGALPARGQSESKAGATASAASRPSSIPTTSDVKLSAAERILRLEETIGQTRAELDELKKNLDDPESEYAKAKEEFTRLDKRLKEREREAETQPAADPNRLQGLRKARELAKERFDLAIQERTATQQKYTLLEKKLQQDSAALAQMRDPQTVAASRPAAEAESPAAATEKLASPAGEGVSPVPPQATVKLPAMPSVSVPAQPTPPTTPANGESAQTTNTAPAATKELLEAQQKAQEKEAAARQAAEQLKSVAERIATLRENIEAEQKLLDTARQRSRIAQQSYATRREYVQKLLSEGAPPEQTKTVWERVDEAEKQSANAEKDVNERIERLDALKSELAELQSEHIGALEQAAKAKQELEHASEDVKRLQNPFSFFRILQWMIDHGPPIIGILLAMAVLIWLTKVTENRIVRFIAIRGDGGTEDEREARARTLASVFRNVASTVIVVGGVLMVLTEVEINIIPLLGAASVVGLAVAFGAQSLIKDYFSGFIILLENQYAINDVIRIGDLSGLVEHISLRMTVLRDTEGNAHFIPHGEIKSVTNMTHGWSRAVFDIGVAYKESVDQVIQVLTELAKELRRDVAFSPLILDDPEMLGVDSLGDSAVVIKFFIKTRPLRQWTVKREMLRRIKNRFDELGIEIPFPHRTIYHRYEGQQPEDGEVLSPLPARKS